MLPLTWGSRIRGERPRPRGRPQGPEGPALRKGPEEEKGRGPAPHGAQEADGVCPCVCVCVCACVCVCPSTCLPPPTCSSGPVDLEGRGRAHVLTQGWGVSCTDFCWGGGDSSTSLKFCQIQSQPMKSTWQVHRCRAGVASSWLGYQPHNLTPMMGRLGGQGCDAP